MQRGDAMKNVVLESVRRLNKVIKRQASIVHPNSRGKGHGRLLRIILENEGISAKELAIALDIRQPSLTEKLDRLESDGHIVRMRDRRDMRVVRISITKMGREAIKRHEKEKEIVRQDFSDCLSEEEQQLFCSFCERLSNNMEEIIKTEKAEIEELIMMNLKHKEFKA